MHGLLHLLGYEHEAMPDIVTQADWEGGIREGRENIVRRRKMRRRRQGKPRQALNSTMKMKMLMVRTMKGTGMFCRTVRVAFP